MVLSRGDGVPLCVRRNEGYRCTMRWMVYIGVQGGGRREGCMVEEGRGRNALRTVMATALLLQGSVTSTWCTPVCGVW